MTAKEYLSKGLSDVKCLIRLYAARTQRKIRDIPYIRFFMWLIAWGSFWANLILIWIYVVTKKISKGTMNDISIGLLVLAILCAIVARIASLPEDYPQKRGDGPSEGAA